MTSTLFAPGRYRGHLTRLAALSVALTLPAQASTPVGPLQVPSPDWRDQVIYFVLTDRFADGDASNNDQGAGEFNPQSSSHYSGGDLAGIRQQLDYIQGLGATALWLTPPVANQWWSRQAQYGGYHGYWAVDFLNVDKHLGSLADYQALSRDLHGRGMYLVQDIVVNHTGNFFTYSGPYDPANTAKNFVLTEPAGSRFAAPSQPPFQLVNRLDPAHQRAAIYHWTPAVQDPSVPGQEFQYQVGTLADLNTSNPQVRAALKHSYRYWLEAAGVDAYRIDTAKYVEHEFWQDFLHAPDGVLAKARELGKQDFLAFGEVFEASAPYSNAGEHKLQKFLGSRQQPELNSVIAFPLYFELNRVLAEGQPPAQLAYRLAQHSQLFAEPHRLPTFLNNHDTNRFLAAGSPAAFLQAYAVLFTVPGIPVIYQGDEQLLSQSRQAMFKTGWGSGGRDWFDRQSPMYRQLQSLAQLRREHAVLRRGQWQPLQADRQGAGILAYQMTLPASQSQAAEQVLVVLNTADSPRLAADLPLSSASVLWQSGFTQPLPRISKQPGHSGLSLLLPARAVLVLRPEQSARPAQPPQAVDTPLILPEPPTQPLTGDYRLEGQGPADIRLQPVLDGDPSRLPAIRTDANGRFALTLPVRDWGKRQHQLQLFQPDGAPADAQGLVSGLVSGKVVASWPYQTEINTAALKASVTDPAGDDKGPDGSYTQPQQPHSQHQLDLLALHAKSGGAVLELTIQLAQVSQFWAPANGFDNVHLALFFDIPQARHWPAQGQALPGLQHQLAGAARWQLGHYLFGWGNALFSAAGATADDTGAKLSGAPEITVEPAAGLIRLRYNGHAFGITDWAGSRIYLSTWDKTGEGQLRSLQAAPGEWHFSAANPAGPKILDDISLTLPTLQ